MYIIVSVVRYLFRNLMYSHYQLLEDEQVEDIICVQCWCDSERII